MGLKKEKRIILEVKNLSLNYHTLKNETAAIKNMNLNIYDKEFLTIVGPSGCGKSTFLSLIAGIMTASGGEINFKNFSFSEVGYMFQKDCLFPWKSIKENALLGLEIKKSLNKKSEKFVDDLFQKYNLKKFEDHYPRQLSGGMRQKAALIRTLAVDPGILLLDEPFSALDGHLRDALKIELRDLLAQFGGAVLMVTHDRTEAYNMASRIAVMDKGSFLTLRPTKELFADPGSVQAAVITGCKNIAAAHRIDEHTVEVPEWGVRLETKQRVEDGLCAVGIRAHYFNAAAQ